MTRVLKYELSMHGETIIRVAVDEPFRPLQVDWQEDRLYLWAEATPGDADEPWTDAQYLVTVVLTGEEVPDVHRYIGSATHPLGNGGAPFVVHVYWRPV